MHRVILMIEDDPDTRELTEAFLEIAGFEVRTASTAAEGVALAKSLQPAAILLDLSLPDATGFDVRRRLLDDPTTKSIPVLALTGHTLEGEDRAFFSNVMRKPVDLDSVVKWLKESGAAPRPQG